MPKRLTTMNRTGNTKSLCVCVWAGACAHLHVCIHLNKCVSLNYPYNLLPVYKCQTNALMQAQELHDDGFKAMVTHKIQSPIPPKHSIILPLTFFLHFSTANQSGDEVKAVFNDCPEKRVDWCPHTQRPKEVRSIWGVQRLNSGCDESGGTVVSTSLGSGCGIGRLPGQFQESENESTCTSE